MITLTDRDIAVERIDYRIIDVLHSWLSKEKDNLDSFIANPETHVNYNPYLIPDFNALKKRSYILGIVVHSLVIISGHKKDGTYTRTQHDEAIEIVPVVLLKRLYDWMDKRLHDMNTMYSEYDGTMPNKEYVGLVSFDSIKFLEELSMYQDSFSGLGILIKYKQEQILANQPPPVVIVEDPPPVDDGSTDEPPIEEPTP
jgi:hypothetical protein